MIRHFFEVKAQHPEAILLYRVGDFYETYSDDAVTASKILGLVLTARTNGDAGKIHMAGFPHHAIDTYLPKLVRAGYKVAVCDQLEDPKLVKNKLVKRGVTELVTPGIAFNESMLEQKENNFLAGLYFEGDKVGAAFLDVSTGMFQVTQGSLDYIKTLFASMSPKEMIVQRGYERGVKERFSDKIYLTSLDEWAFVYDSAVNKLCKQLGVNSLKGFAVERYPLGVCAAGALVNYLEQTLHEGLRNICSISRIDENKFVWMDSFTLNNLEVLHSQSREGTSLIDIMDRCVSPMGARMLHGWLGRPVLDIKELNSRYDTVQFFLDNPDERNEVRSRIADIGDLERIISRAAAGKIAPREALKLGGGLSQIEPIRDLCSGEKAPQSLVDTAKTLRSCAPLIKKITETLAENAAAAIGKGDVIATGASKELDELREISRDGKQYLLHIQEREAESTGIPSLKIGYNNVFGYYIEVRNTFKDKVPPEWVRKQTLVSAERYITQELKEYEEKILSAEDRIYQLESEIYARLVEEIRKNIAAIQADSQALSRIDVLACFAENAADRRWTRPEIDKGYALDIKGGRHPVIEDNLPAGEEYVPNDVFLDDEKQQIIVLTGPNMARKSALLRQTALIVLMAQTGSFVPADSAHIGICDKIFTRVGASDNISRGESTFMVEMTETAMILHNLSRRSLVLLDEIGRGTSTYDGMSIARSIVEYIHEWGEGAKTLFATHYHELNDLTEIYPRVKNYHIAVKEVGKEVIFLRKMLPGGTEESFGINVARMAGMPAEVLEAAEKTLRALEANKQAGKPIKEYGTIMKPAKARNIKEGTIESDGSLQLSFFQLDDPALESIRDHLKDADLNNMTPMQAFDLLRSMKSELGL